MAGEAGQGRAGGARSPTTAIPCQTPGAAQQLHAKPSESQLGMQRLLEGVLTHFRPCHLGDEAETEGNLFSLV